MEPVFELKSVVKDFSSGLLGRRKLRALDGVHLKLQPGQVLGLVGPNRAGKTTIVKLVLSLSRPTQGEVLRFGRPASDRRTLARVGYVHENQAFPRYLSAQALLEYYGALSLLSESVVKERVPQLLKTVELADRSREPVSRFSKGMMQRLGVAQALLNDPDLLVMDEPNEGLDLAGRQMMRAIVQEQQARGRAVLLVSHVLADVETLCNQIGVLIAGRFVFQGPIAEFIGESGDGETRTLESALEQVYRSTSQDSTATQIK